MSPDSPLLTVSRAALPALRARIAAFVHGSEPLTGSALYLLLERSTPLSELHGMLRLGPQNRTRNGLQQSYGDHNRLLLLGLDKLEAGDLAWYRSRLEPASDVSDDALLDCFAAVRALGLTASLRVALWLAAALHDCGRLARGGAGVDVEDGVELAREIVRALCPAELHDLARFVVRNHDYVKDVFFGEVPVSFIAAQVERLAPSLRATALAALGMVQVAGAASLGAGRLSRMRVEIFRRCLDGRVLADPSARARLARLLDPPQLEVPEATARRSDAAITDGAVDGPALRRFLEGIPVHGWYSALGGSLASPHRRLAVIGAVAERFEADFADHDHVVIGRTVDLASAGEPGWRLPTGGTIKFRNGTAAMLVGGA